MKIRTLQNASLSILTDAFNKAFSDYLIPFQLTEDEMGKKIQGDQIDLSLSPGCFVDEELCGFIFHGIVLRDGKRNAWNGGTGVIPRCRGQGIASQLYDFIIPLLKDRAVVESTLEVIDENKSAIHVYQRCGFETVRELLCYKGVATRSDRPQDVELRTIGEVDWDRLHGFWSWKPTFQNAEHKISQLRDEIEIIGAYKNELLVGYIAFANDLKSGNVYQFAVDEKARGSGVGLALFSRAMEGKTVPLSVVNVDASHLPTIGFLETIGLQRTVRQMEMALKI